MTNRPANQDTFGFTIEVLDDPVAIRRRTGYEADGTNLPLDSADALRWLEAVRLGLQHDVYLILISDNESIKGMLPLLHMKSRLFGRFLVSLPYINSAGVIADDPMVARLLIDKAIQLADELRVRYLELRHEREIPHDGLTDTICSKVHMRLALPDTSDELWNRFKSKHRSVIRKGEQNGFAAEWGSHELVPDFHSVFSSTMRDLGTPVFGRRLFDSILDCFGDAAELCVVRRDNRPIAAALLVHSKGTTIVPSAASLHSMNSTNANPWMYWNLLQRAIQRKQTRFDFGRTTPGSNTFAFKKKWGALPEPAVWQYYVREGSVTDMRPEGGKYDRAVKIWQKLPLPLTRLIGPSIVRGIP